uniref:Ribosomal protein L5 n=1 Tax=Acanthamoeba polyphaga TaxID=5757 RepID=A0A0S0IL87_ACAPO|nr:ribosomal protein L5 [Acanthamoeba polyphaga]
MRFYNSYNNLLKNCLLCNTNLFNTNTLKIPLRPNLSAIFNTFKGEKSLKLIRLYLLILYISNQKPFIKKVKFNYIKKKILKRFFISVSLSKKNSFNFFMYLLNFYNYFFHIYYQKHLKYNILGNSLILYIDNIQFFFRNYNKHSQKTQIKLTLDLYNNSADLLFRYLNNMFLIRIKN